jgi:hypothetical protein
MAWVFFGTLVLAAASSLVIGGTAIVSGAVDEDYANVAGGVVSFMIGGGWAAVAHFTRPVLFNRPVDNDGPRAYVLLNQPVEQGDPS